MSHQHNSRHDDSFFSIQQETTEAHSIRGPNPFVADAKKSYIKKINTEAYLSQDPSAMAMFAMNQQTGPNNPLSKGRTKTLADNIVLSAPSKGDIDI